VKDTILSKNSVEVKILGKIASAVKSNGIVVAYAVSGLASVGKVKDIKCSVAASPVSAELH
jgi:hypothetical protein